MRIRNVAIATLAAAVAAGGMLAGSIGVAEAGKPVLNGTMTCAIGSTINIAPSLVLSIPNKKEATDTKPAVPGKDKAPKLTSVDGVLSGCTGTAAPTSPAIPAGGTSTSKSKGASRLCGGGIGGGTGTTAKTTFADGSKMKGVSTTGGGGAFDPVTQTTHLFVDGDIIGTVGWINSHPNDRLTFTQSGTSGGKAFAGKTVQTKVVTTETVTNLFFTQCASVAGLSAFHLDPAFSRITIS